MRKIKNVMEIKNACDEMLQHSYIEKYSFSYHGYYMNIIQFFAHFAMV